MMQTLRCIRFGEVLMDENHKLCLLCINCHTDYTSMIRFQAHLRHCTGAEALVAKNAKIKYPGSSESKIVKNQEGLVTQFLIHNINEVIEGSVTEEPDNEIKPLDLDAELMDPRWYTNLDRTSPVETPAVHLNNKLCRLHEKMQCKENVNTSDSRNPKPSRNGVVKTTSPSNGKRSLLRSNAPTKDNGLEASGSKTVLLNKLIQHQSCSMSTRAGGAKTVLNGLPSGKAVETTTKAFQPVLQKPRVSMPVAIKRAPSIDNESPSKRVAIAAAPLDAKPRQMIISNRNNTQTNGDHMQPASTTVPASTQQTEQILNKLQNLGLQIKRTSNTKNASPDIATVKDSKTMELMKKLQSKGIKCSVIKKESQLPSRTCSQTRFAKLNEH